MKLINKLLSCVVLMVVVLTSALPIYALQNTDSYSHSKEVEKTPLTDYIKMEGFALDEGVNGNTNMPTGVGVPATQPSFFSNVFDGSSLWLCASSSDKLVKVSTDTGSMRGYSFVNGDNNNTNMGNTSTKSGRFAGGALVNNEIWFAPYSIDRLVKVDITTGTMTGFELTNGVNGNTNLDAISTTNGKFSGSIYDGTNVWLIPAASSRLVKVNPQTGTMTGFELTEDINGNQNMPTGTNFFNGAVYDGTYIWMIPSNSSKVVRLDPATGSMRGFDMTEGVKGNTNMGNLGNEPLLATYRFYGGVYDGTHIWMIPGNANRVVRLDPTTGTMTGFDMAEGVNGNANMGTADTASYKFSLGNFDGKHIWMFPSYANRLVKLDPQTGSMTGYNLEEGETGQTINTNMGDVPTTTFSRFYGGSFDGENFWLSPWRTNRLVKVSSNAASYTIEYYIDSYSNPPIETKTGQSTFVIGHQLTQADIDAEFGQSWVNAFQSRGFGSGTATYPVIAENAADNVVTVLYTRNQYTVSYSANSTVTTSALPPDTLYTYGSPVTVAPGITSSTDFLGWNTMPDGTGTQYKPGDTFNMPYHDVTLYAIVQQAGGNPDPPKTGDDSNALIWLSVFMSMGLSAIIFLRHKQRT